MTNINALMLSERMIVDYDLPTPDACRRRIRYSRPSLP
jgi:hypothetical protein